MESLLIMMAFVLVGFLVAIYRGIELLGATNDVFVRSMAVVIMVLATLFSMVLMAILATSRGLL